ncbi:M4 family metallopeptidase [Methylorubrum extorquens]
MTATGMTTSLFHAYDRRCAPVKAALDARGGCAAATATVRGLELSELDPETAARSYLRQAVTAEEMPGILDELSDGTEVTFRSLGTETLALSRSRVVKFRQHVHAIPVRGSLVSVELEFENGLIGLHATLGDPVGIDPVATLSPAGAFRIARRAAGAVDGVPTIRLWYDFDEAAARWRLVYIVEDLIPGSAVERRAGPGGAAGCRGGSDKPIPCPSIAVMILSATIDAHTGEVVEIAPSSPMVAPPSFEIQLDQYPGVVWSIRVAEGVEGYEMIDVDAGVRTHDFFFGSVGAGGLPGRIVGNPPDWTAPAIMAHANTLKVADFLREVLRLDGVDNRGAPIVSSVNCTDGVDPEVWENAQWLSDRKQFVYGQTRVDGKLRSFASCLAIVAHEIFHAVTAASGKLGTTGEQGALNESYSDILAILLANHDKQDRSSWHWEIGVGLGKNGAALRDLAQPARFGQPEHMDQFQRLPPDNDHGGVHLNSGIHNKAAHSIMTATDAGGQMLFSATELAGLFYQALANHLSAKSTFADSRHALEMAAFSLFRNDSLPTINARVNTIQAAFDNVGIKEIATS